MYQINNENSIFEFECIYTKKINQVNSFTLTSWLINTITDISYLMNYYFWLIVMLRNEFNEVSLRPLYHSFIFTGDRYKSKWERWWWDTFISTCKTVGVVLWSYKLWQLYLYYHLMYKILHFYHFFWYSLANFTLELFKCL